MSENVLKFEIGVIENYIGDEDVDFSIMKLQFLSDGYNAHGIPISNEVLKECAATIIGKPIVAKYNSSTRDVEGHEIDEVVVGVVPNNASIYFEETDNGEFACVEGVIFKLYAPDIYNIYQTHNGRAVSVEMTVDYQDDNVDLAVTSFNIRGVTLLGLDYEPSCTLASSEITRFSKEAVNFYKDRCETNSLQEFAERRKSLLADNKTYKVDKSKESVSSTPWEDVDKTAMRNKITEAANAGTLVHDVYLKVADGWEKSPSGDLKYPVMQLKGDTFVYNEHAISSALGRARTNDPNLVTKITNLQKKLGLYKGEGEEEKMSKELENKVGTLENETLETTKTEEATLETEVDKETMVDDEKEDAKEEAEETEEMSSDANVDPVAYEDMLEQEAEKNKNLTAQLEAKDNIIMEMETELEGLRKFKAEKEELEKETEMERTFLTIEEAGCKFSDEEKAKFKEKAKNCTLSGLSAVKNEMQSVAFERKAKEFKENKDKDSQSGLWNFSAAIETEEKKEDSLWS